MGRREARLQGKARNQEVAGLRRCPGGPLCVRAVRAARAIRYTQGRYVVLFKESKRSDARSTIIATAATIMHRPPFSVHCRTSRAQGQRSPAAAVPQPNCTTTASIKTPTLDYSSEPLRCTRVPSKVGARRLNRKSALVANMNDRL